MTIYCINCKKHTETHHEHHKNDKNGHPRLHGGCASCGHQKSKPMAGKGIKGGKKRAGGSCTDRPVSTTGANVVSPMHVRPIGQGISPMKRVGRGRKQKGGQLDEILDAIPAIQGLVGQLIPVSQKTTDFFNNYLHGSGFPKKKSKHFKYGVMTHHMAKMHGGSAWDDFVQGFSWGFQHPIDALEAGVKAIGNAIDGKGLCPDDKSNRMGIDHNCGEKTNDWQEEQRQWVGKGFEECDCAHQAWNKEHEGPPRSGAGKRKSKKKGPCGRGFEECDCAHKAWNKDHGIGSNSYESLAGAGGMGGAGLTFY